MNLDVHGELNVTMYWHYGCVIMNVKKCFCGSSMLVENTGGKVVAMIFKQLRCSKYECRKDVHFKSFPHSNLLHFTQ